MFEVPISHSATYFAACGRQLCVIDSFLHPRIVNTNWVSEITRVRYSAEDNFLMEKPAKRERTKQRQRGRVQIPREEEYADSDAD